MGIVCAEFSNMSNDTEHSADDHPMPGKHARLGYLLLAYSATALGIAGAFLPLLPTTPFLLVAVWAAPKGSQRVHDWIYQQPQFARLLDDWQQQGIAHRLMQGLIQTARSHSLQIMEGEVLSSNQEMLNLATKLGFSIASSEIDRTVKHISRQL